VILVDTSVWVDHLRSGDIGLTNLLNQSRVLIHPFIIGELACGIIRDRQSILQLLQDLPVAPVADNNEVLYFMEEQQLMGRGIGYIDAHLLASVVLEDSSRLWTRDNRLAKLASELNLAHESSGDS